MSWNRSGEVGWVKEPYRIGKFVVDEGALCTLYGLYHNHDTLGFFNSFEECQEAAEAHEKAKP